MHKYPVFHSLSLSLLSQSHTFSNHTHTIASRFTSSLFGSGIAVIWYEKENDGCRKRYYRCFIAFQKRAPAWVRVEIEKGNQVYYAHAYKQTNEQINKQISTQIRTHMHHSYSVFCFKPVVDVVDVIVAEQSHIQLFSTREIEKSEPNAWMNVALHLISFHISLHTLRQASPAQPHDTFVCISQYIFITCALILILFFPQYL